MEDDSSEPCSKKRQVEHDKLYFRRALRKKKSGGKFGNNVRMDMQQVADMLLSTEVMTLLVVITHLMLLFPTQFCAGLIQTFLLTKSCSTTKDSSTRLKDRQDITPQNPALALKKLIVTICLVSKKPYSYRGTEDSGRRLDVLQL